MPIAEVFANVVNAKEEEVAEEVVDNVEVMPEA